MGFHKNERLGEADHKGLRYGLKLAASFFYSVSHILLHGRLVMGAGAPALLYTRILGRSEASNPTISHVKNRTIHAG